MTVNYERTAVSLSHGTLDEVEERANKPLSASYVIDRDLTRYYSLLNVARTASRDKLNRTERSSLFSALGKMHADWRTSRVPFLRNMISAMVLEGMIEGQLADKVEELSNDEFLALIDDLEQQRYSRKEKSS